MNVQKTIQTCSFYSCEYYLESSLQITMESESNTLMEMWTQVWDAF